MGYYEKDTALELANKFKTTDPFEIAERLNINVFYQNLHPSIMGFYKYHKKNQYICINENLDDHSQIVTCAHELGHCKMHKHINTPFLRTNTFLTVDKLERQANLFAVELLMPDEDWYAYIKKFKTIDAISCYAGISEELLLLKYKKTIGCPL
ncbi:MULTISPECIES: ImmA/IrrE family metallo-endopeptidase [Bacillus]|uniref:ImmA/IrrE family metallo-endopeptidase n=1 Tax=Bacillus TaxID=1386 RepID=UPI0003639073|nr:MULTISPECIES: ImmA/IrrE family metallo-endopeptidase [Bacillus]MED1539126.1 ImmA/IrrE family metallo-endopeptidase [Bacillus pseudomycoides]PGC41457.1 ImmA/IrrE family metallo-endopeptidase [Bacillus pseudomycoides]